MRRNCDILTTVLALLMESVSFFLNSKEYSINNFIKNVNDVKILKFL